MKKKTIKLHHEEAILDIFMNADSKNVSMSENNTQKPNAHSEFVIRLNFPINDALLCECFLTHIFDMQRIILKHKLTRGRC